MNAVISPRSVAAAAIKPLSAFTSLSAPSWEIQVSFAYVISQLMRNTIPSIQKYRKLLRENNVVSDEKYDFMSSV